MTRILLILAGLGFLGFGVAIVVAPIAVFAGIDLAFPDTPLGRIEVRAFYGGLELGIGALLLAAAFRPEHYRAGLWLTLGSYGAIGLTRALAMSLEGGFSNSFLITALVIELGFGAAAGALLLKRR